MCQQEKTTGTQISIQKHIKLRTKIRKKRRSYGNIPPELHSTVKGVIDRKVKLRVKQEMEFLQNQMKIEKELLNAAKGKDTSNSKATAELE